MGKQNDSLIEVEGPDRVHYATGVLLNAEDFQAEQDYHRGRLARALRYANGWGTLAGLEVIHEPAIPASTTDDGREERIMIKPGLAIDRLGRLIEVASPLCLRLGVWYQQQRGDKLDDSLKEASQSWSGSQAGVAADIFIRYAACERGKTPAFATSAFDTIDAVTAARLRDGYETELVLRGPGVPPVPDRPWSDISGGTKAERTAQARASILNTWQESSRDDNLDGPEALAEHLHGQDTTSLFLARLVIPATRVAPGVAPARIDSPTVTVQVNNELRPFVITSNALARILDVDINAASSS
jgi:hypothetical protein